MDASAIQAKYTRVVKIAGKWNCYLQIDHQGFCIVDNRTKKEANWYAKMIGIALERLVASVKNTEQQVQADPTDSLTKCYTDTLPYTALRALYGQRAKPEGNEMEETEEDKAIFQAMCEAEEKLEKERAENNKAAFKEIRKLVSAYKVRKLREYMSETDYWNLKIVDTHGAVKPQDEPYWFKQAYVSQSCGYSGDDYSGTIWIPLPNGKYLKFLFCC